jgi:hypothetical protein
LIYIHKFTKQAKRAKVNVCCQKTDGNHFPRQERVLMVEFLQQGTSLTLEMYCKTLKALGRAVQNKRHGMLTPSVVFLHDNVHLHSAACISALVEHFNWEFFVHSPHGPICPELLPPIYLPEEQAEIKGLQH